MIGNQIEVKILSVDGDQVKIGIVAPKSVKVHRSEVFQSIQEQNKAALEVDLKLLGKITKKEIK